MSLSAKEKKKLRDKLRDRTRINIGSCFEEWREIMKARKLGNDQLLCRYLLDMYKDMQNVVQTPNTCTSATDSDETLSCEGDDFSLSEIITSTSLRHSKQIQPQEEGEHKRMRLDTITSLEDKDVKTDSCCSRDSLIQNTLQEKTDANCFHRSSADNISSPNLENLVHCVSSTGHKVQHEKAVQPETKTHNVGMSCQRKYEIVTKPTQLDKHTRDIGTNTPSIIAKPIVEVKTEGNDAPSCTVDEADDKLNVNVKVEGLKVEQLSPVTEVYTYL